MLAALLGACGSDSTGNGLSEADARVMREVNRYVNQWNDAAGKWSRA